VPDAELCIRIMKRFFEEVYADPELSQLMARTNADIDLRCIYREVLREELGPHTFKVACASFFENLPLRTRQLLEGVQ
jgi:hypothetical protein